MEDSRQMVNNPSSAGHTLNELLPISRVIIHMMFVCEFIFQTPLALLCHRHPECKDWGVEVGSIDECCGNIGIATSTEGQNCEICFY